MTTLPRGVERRQFDGTEALATRGRKVYGEPTTGEWRRWSRERSKLAGMLERGFDTGLSPDATVLYLGASSGTTASHVADLATIVYAVEFAPRPMRDLLEVASDRGNLVPLLKDARRPETYAHVVESEIDVVIQDVATRGQAAVALANRQFLAPDGRLVLAIKARSEDVTRPPDDVFEEVLADLEEGYEIAHTARLDPQHADHLGVLARPSE